MNRFARLFGELDASTSTNAKLEALQRYYAEADAADAAWATYFLAGGKPRQVVATARLRALVRRQGRHAGVQHQDRHGGELGDLGRVDAAVVGDGQAIRLPVQRQQVIDAGAGQVQLPAGAAWGVPAAAPGPA